MSDQLQEIRDALRTEQEARPIWDRADRLTREFTAFPSFYAMLTAPRPDYRPTLRSAEGEDAVWLADVYDAAQEIRGKSNRAHRGR